MSVLEEQVFYIDPEMQDGTFAAMSDDEKIDSHLRARVGMLFNSFGSFVVRASAEQMDNYKQANPERYTALRDEVTANLIERGLLEQTEAAELREAA
jgi:hypothetical protein